MRRALWPALLVLLGCGFAWLIGGVIGWWRLAPEDAPPATPLPKTSAPPVPAMYASPDTIGRFPRSQFFIEHDRFLAADEPATVPAEEARFLEDDDEVLGFVLGRHARAYPVTMLSYHHVVNDVLGDVPVAVFY